MLQPLSGGGEYAFSARVKTQGAASGPVDFAVTTRVDGSTVADASLGIITASDSDWVELASVNLDTRATRPLEVRPTTSKTSK